MSGTAFLRSPPFPGVAPAVAAVSRSGADGAGHVSDEVLNAIAGARVGGAFWGQRHGGFRVIVRAGVAGIIDHVPAAEIAVVGRTNGAVRGTQLTGTVDPWALMDGAQSVHAPEDDELAIVAGLMNVPVHGVDGGLIPPERLREAARRAVATACYRNCFTGDPAGVAEVVFQLSEWRRQLDANRGIAAATGMAWWKREAMRRFLWDGMRSPPFLSPRNALRRAAREKGGVAYWPSRVPATFVGEAQAQGVAVAKVEDGFLRSKGLGAALTPPGSVVIDHSGIYYDARGPSDLETLLATHDFAPALIERARRLRSAIRASGVTKYGLEAGGMPDLPAGRRTVLVVGQVEDDLSVQQGGAGVAGNLALLERARQAEPDAYILYRPHPDVQAGLRRGHLTDATVLEFADIVDTGAPLMALVQAVDDVHVLSSLTGFEALLRDRPVTVHGMPFYAGWGLTRDLAQPNGRRGRQLTIDQLVAAALILYPYYLDPVTRLPCGPEIMVERMAGGSKPPISWLIRLRMMQGKIQRFMTLSAERFHG
ncbi:beta-3-deoxy-D-manno-oct-2-ulosonic acid transferase [Sphingobium vermicomposti]|uniref:Capsular polysaccharide export protein n=1 Tax=Sphingobium vermicomposti TaxID=529005 RepID=A0A846M6V9_9SPHN|nr:beta-3-deoxy-D-manno-oct-2-ulosonic acid transferase [Sphingobium vermicomposti]NIJ17223.1 capsular polysaccharide export protein [Sphingobium vermicomposti]